MRFYSYLEFSFMRFILFWLFRVLFSMGFVDCYCFRCCCLRWCLIVVGDSFFGFIIFFIIRVGLWGDLFCCALIKVLYFYRFIVLPFRWRILLKLKSKGGPLRHYYLRVYYFFIFWVIIEQKDYFFLYKFYKLHLSN